MKSNKDCVVFVGDSPSPKNVRGDIAFVGASCFNRLTEWISFISPRYYVCYNSDTVTDLLRIIALEEAGFTIVALGQVASTRLQDQNISHYGLPHPSGLNRLNNDQEYINRQLTFIKNAINGGQNAQITNP